MLDVNAALQTQAKEYLTSGRVRQVIGYACDPATGLPIPFIAHSPEEADRLVFGPLCTHGLVRHISGRPMEPTAIVARACDTRAIAARLQENEFAREDVVIIAVGCAGVMEPERLTQHLPRWQRVLSVEVEGDTVRVTTDAGAAELSLRNDAMARCIACRTPEPVLADVRLGEFPPPNGDAVSPYRALVAELKAMSREERRAYFEQGFARCIRCLACRNVCPLCSCERCFVDETRPQWVPRSTLGGENELFHSVRAMHLAGRCTECGACEAACPAGVPLMALNAKMAMEVEAMFDHVAGMDPEAKPLFARYESTDPDLPGHGGDA